MSPDDKMIQLTLPDSFSLMHARAPYDPAKAHEYYEKHKQLKGRKPGRGSYTVKGPSGHSVKLSAQQLAEQKAYASHRVEQLKQKLRDLATLLRKKMADAKEAERKSNQPKTLKQKAQEARDAKKYRDKHQNEIASKAKKAASSSDSSSKKKGDTVDSLKGEIKTARASLKNAVAKQRALATAKKSG